MQTGMFTLPMETAITPSSVYDTRTMLEKAAKQLYMHKINMVLGSAGKA
jgi:hypothetical protein